MDGEWSDEQLQAIAAARELEIAVPRADGSLRAAVPIWVVVADGAVHVRTWHRRDTGWFGRAVATRWAVVRVPGVEAEVVVTEIGAADRDAIDRAYRAKYGDGGSTDAMVGEAAVATTLRLAPALP